MNEKQRESLEKIKEHYQAFVLPCRVHFLDVIQDVCESDRM